MSWKTAITTCYEGTKLPLEQVLLFWYLQEYYIAQKWKHSLIHTHLIKFVFVSPFFSSFEQQRFLGLLGPGPRPKTSAGPLLFTISIFFLGVGRLLATRRVGPGAMAPSGPPLKPPLVLSHMLDRRIHHCFSYKLYLLPRILYFHPRSKIASFSCFYHKISCYEC